MDFINFTNEQLFGLLIIGAIGYWIASGASRADYKAFHVALGISVFSVLWLGFYWITGLCLDNILAKIAFSSVATAVAAGFWRRWLANEVFHWLREWGITSDAFGPSGAWNIITTTPDKRVFHKYCIYMKNGERLISNSSLLQKKYKQGKFGVSPHLVTDVHGNIGLVVTKIFDKDAKKSRKIDPVHDDGRVQFTYIPTSNIEKIDVDIKKQ